MGEAGYALRLAPETPDELLVVRVLISKDFERYVSSQYLIMREVNVGHAPTPQRLDQIVTIVYDGTVHAIILYLPETARKPLPLSERAAIPGSPVQ
jgi:hypothetical protein